MGLGERIVQLRGTTSVAEFCRRFGIHRNTLPRYESGERTPDANFIVALCREYKVNAHWLLTGEGPRYRDQKEDIQVRQPSADRGIDEQYIQVPRYEVNASAGGGAVVYSEQIVDYLSFRTDWVQNALGVSVKDLALINVIGDSMEPTLSEGDVVLLDMTTKGIMDSAVYVLQLNGSLLVKRIQRKLDGSLVVKSDNKLYEPEVVSSETAGRLKIIGRVVWAGRKF